MGSLPVDHKLLLEEQLSAARADQKKRIIYVK